MEEKIKQCPEFPFFGASYPDAICCDGYLWDLDSYDSEVGGLTIGGDVPCPFCKTEEFIEHDPFSKEDEFYEGIEDEEKAKEGYLDKKLCGDCRLIEDEDANGEAWCAFHQKPVRCDSRACEDILEKGAQNA